MQSTYLVKNIKCYRVVHVVNYYSKYRTLGWGYCTLTNCGATKRSICCLDSCHSLKDCLSTLEIEKDFRNTPSIIIRQSLHTLPLFYYFIEFTSYIPSNISKYLPWLGHCLIISQAFFDYLLQNNLERFGTNVKWKTIELITKEYEVIRIYFDLDTVVIFFGGYTPPQIVREYLLLVLLSEVVPVNAWGTIWDAQDRIQFGHIPSKCSTSSEISLAPNMF